MIDHAAQRQLELENPEVAAFKKVILDAIMKETTTAFRQHNLSRRDMLTEISGLINKIPVDVCKNSL